MTKYSYELKMKIVTDYLNGTGGYKFLAKKYEIKSPSSVTKWINNYKMFGPEGLEAKRTREEYTVQFKLDAIKLYKQSQASYHDVANTLNMTEPSLIANWCKTLEKEGSAGLSKQKGRPSMKKSNKNNATPNRKNKKLSKSDASVYEAKIKELEQELLIAKLDNAILKERRRMWIQEQQEKMKRQHD